MKLGMSMGGIIIIIIFILFRSDLTEPPLAKLPQPGITGTGHG